MTFQQSFIGEDKFVGTDHQKALHILREYPEARNDYKAAMVAWWIKFDGLGKTLSVRKDRTYFFREWFLRKATPPHTIRNRIQEVQNEYPHLDASEETEEYRQKRSKQGILS